MMPLWAILAGAEVAWLAGLWLFIPESRPWRRPAHPATSPPGPAGKPLGASLFFLAYYLYHLPALLAVNLVHGVGDGWDVEHEASPAELIFVGVVTAVVYAVLGQMFFGG